MTAQAFDPIAHSQRLARPGLNLLYFPMMNALTRRTHFIPLLLAIAVPLLGCSKRKADEPGKSAEKQQIDHTPQSGGRQTKNIRHDKDTQSLDVDKPQDDTRFQKEFLENLIASWDQVATEYKGEELLHKQWEIEKRVAALGPGDALLRFFDFLASKGANDIRERVISEMGNAIFSGKDAEKSRQWLLTVQDQALREKLCRYAGKYHPKEGIKEYLNAFGSDTKCQSAVLTGYCRGITKSDPAGAVKAFTDLRPLTVNFGGLVEVMSVLPPETDFAAISSTLPEDTQNIAKRARAAMLQSWTASRPEEAAQYVISNTTLASPEQMGVVVKAWSKTAPDDAARWIAALSPSPIKDEGTTALVNYWTAKDPVKAWEFATQVKDPNKRVTNATEVFKEWEKTDREAATKAWVALFPGG